MSRISVIIPVYNVEDYIDQCLESLQAQTLRDIEIICVNDGSPDDSAAKLAAWSQRDSRIKVVDKSNGGLSSARNAGVEASTSSYVCFLDADDALQPNACQRIVEAFTDGLSEVVTFGALCVPSEKAAPWISEALSPRDAFYPSFDPAIIFKENSRPFAWRTACRRDFLLHEGVRFDEDVRFGEDQVFHFAVYARAKGVRFLSDKLYRYNVARPGSLMDRFKNDFHQKLLEHVNIVDHILADWGRCQFMDACPEQLLTFVADYVLYDALKLPDDQYRDIAESLRSVLLNYWPRPELSAFDLSPSIEKMLLEGCIEGLLPSVRRKLLVLEYYTHLHGILGTARKVILRF